MPRVLRCVDLHTALQSLASLFDVSAEHVRRALAPAVARALTDEQDPIGALATTLPRELGTVAHPPDKIHYFHGSRARDPATFVADGLHPLLARLDIVWSELAGLAPEIPAVDLSRLREDLTAGSVEPHTYSLRVNGKIDHRPFGELVRDSLLHPDDYYAVDYLNGAEITSDICHAVRERFGVDLGTRYREATTPCIVEFAVPETNVEGALASAAWYVEAALREQHTPTATGHTTGAGSLSPRRLLSRSSRLAAPS